MFLVQPSAFGKNFALFTYPNRYAGRKINENRREGDFENKIMVRDIAALKRMQHAGFDRLKCLPG